MSGSQAWIYKLLCQQHSIFDSWNVCPFVVRLFFIPSISLFFFVLQSWEFDHTIAASSQKEKKPRKLHLISGVTRGAK